MMTQQLLAPMLPALHLTNDIKNVGLDFLASASERTRSTFLLPEYFFAVRILFKSFLPLGC